MPPSARSTVVDLGHPLTTSDPTWDGQPAFDVTVLAEVARDGYFARRFSSHEHFGTHLDAPAHFVADGWTVDQIPVERLVRPAVCIQVQSKVEKDVDYQLTVEDVLTFEALEDLVPAGSIVLVSTGWDVRWPDQRFYRNERNGVQHFPGLSADAATLLARDRKVVGIVIDTPSVDHGPSETFDVHQVTHALQVYHVENARGLSRLPSRGFSVVVAPINVKGGSGAPARLFALFH